MPSIINLFHPQQVQYNGGVANVKAWKISTYLEVMEGGKERVRSIPLEEQSDKSRTGIGVITASIVLHKYFIYVPFDVVSLNRRFTTRLTPSLLLLDLTGVPCTNPCIPLLDACVPLLDCIDAMFTHWYKQQHACNKPGQPKRTEPYRVKRVMNFITRYTAHPKEQALLKHVDGAGKVDGSAVLALPIDRWTGPESVMR